MIESLDRRMNMNSYMLITGATGGLGSAFAVEAAKMGFDLVLTDLSTHGTDQAARLADKFGVQVLYFPCDLTSEPARTELFAAFREHGLLFWSLVNVAGLDHEGSYLGRSRSQILTILKVNLLANMDISHEILAMRDESRKFRLINVSSMASFYPMPFKATYAATKRFLLDFSLALNEEIRDFGSVTAVCPGGMPTTEECMRAIFAQGFWGWATTVDPYKVARATLKRAMKGSRVYIPGMTNKWLQAISTLLPTVSKVKYVAARWTKSQTELATRRLFTQKQAVVENNLQSKPV
jgi:short-subunit dehydrogenase